MNREIFIQSLKDLGINLTDKQIMQFHEYYNMLIMWNEKINLTSIVNEDDVYLKHFFDSISIYKIIKLDNQSLCDIGTGAGFPGIPLKIAFPNLKLTLVDSLGKRCMFLKEVVNRLNLDNVDIVSERAEIFTNNNREKFDLVTARAVSKLSQLLEISGASVKINGYFIAMKSRINDEIVNLDNCLNKLGFVKDKEVSFLLPIEESERLLILFKKIKKTNIKYPRSFNIIKNKPL